MRKVVAAINMTLDGFCDHTSMVADEQLHDHYTALLNDAGVILYGRKTYQLMESYWPELVKNPTGDKSADDFAIAIENIPKIVFSRTIKQVNWTNVTLLNDGLEQEVMNLKDQTGNDIIIGSPSLITTLTRAGLLDELQLCIHPVIAGAGLTLFKDITHPIKLHLAKTKPFQSGAVVFYYRKTN